MRTSATHTIPNPALFKDQLLYWARESEVAIWLDSNAYDQEYSSYDAVLALGVHSILSMNHEGAFEELKQFQNRTKDWLFGYLGYDLKNDIETLESSNFDGLQFPDLFFFQPEKILLLTDNQVEFRYLDELAHDIDPDLKAIQDQEPLPAGGQGESVHIKLRIHKDAYFEKINEMLSHIHRGDIYEANFCQEFYAEDTHIDPVMVYRNLNTISNPPFATFFKLDDKFLLSASPERYLRKQGHTIISQPIKGTAKRSADPAEDAALRHRLKADPKERSENIMIVDLVRNDLSRVAVPGSVNVEELAAVYTYPQVHQLISTVSAEADPNIHPVDILRATFPMGSMTGAPKISAMTIIEALEETRRGLYSGAVGYFDPFGNFDFNVVIRSILYNRSERYVSFSVGGAITSKSDPTQEYEECLIKAKAMRAVLEQ